MIFNKINSTILTLACLVCASCSTGSSEKSDLGTNVKFITKGTGAKLINQNVLEVNMEFGTESGQIINQSEPGKPLFLYFEEDTANVNGEFQSVLEMLSVGDSVNFNVLASDLFEKTFRQPLPDTLNADDNIVFKIGVLNQMNREEYAVYSQEQQAKFAAERAGVEAKIIDDYLSENGITAETTESGLRYVIIEETNGSKPDPGNKVNVKYRGTLLQGGTEFDAGEYKFELGAGGVIRGWDEGIEYLSLGSKAVLYIPSSLAYGSRGSGRIAPNSPLIFEVELLEIED